VLRLRTCQARNLLATLLLSQGVPMLLGGDELGRTQGGNNNAYCQDNEISWFDWEHVDEDLLEFTRSLVEFRAAHPVFRRRRFFQGRRIRGADLNDIAWFRPDGQQMSDEDWDVGYARSLGVFLNGEGIPDPDARGQRVVDDSFFLLFNASHEALEFTLPEEGWPGEWQEVIRCCQGFLEDGPRWRGGQAVPAEARELIVLQAR
jgi:glycogen operon protein